MRLDELFDVSNGVASSCLKILERHEAGTIPFIRPASTQRRTVAGWVKRDSLNAENIYPKESLFVSTNGEGSHSYSYVSPFEFVPNSDVAVLTPKREMSLQEKIYFAHCITMNRYRFSYGRKPKGERLKRIELPETIPVWVNSTNIQDYTSHLDSVTNEKIALDTSQWKPFEFQSLFEIKKGKRLTKANQSAGRTPYIGAIDKNNGVSSFIGQQAIHEGYTISVSYNGSVAEAFYQPVPFWATDDVNVLYPNFNLTPAIALFIATLIRQEKYRFNYGRKWHMERMKESCIRLPVKTDGTPDWNFMEQYIKSLPYSSQIE